MAKSRTTLAFAVLGLLGAWTEVCAFTPLLQLRSFDRRYTSITRPQQVALVDVESKSARGLRLQQQDTTHQSSTSDGGFTLTAIEYEDGSYSEALRNNDTSARIKTAATVIGQQGILIPVSLVLGQLLGTPFRLDFDVSSVSYGLLAVLPMLLVAVVLDVFEQRVPALKEVTIASQRAVLLFMGGTFRPLFTSIAAMGIGLAAGFGEEMLFRGVIQTKMAEALHAEFSSPADVSAAIAILLSSVMFGALHAVTPLYIVLATLSSIYFGYLMIAFDGNLTVPIICHAVYDFVALVYCHWEIGKMTNEELELLFRRSPQDDESTEIKVIM